MAKGLLCFTILLFWSVTVVELAKVKGKYGDKCDNKKNESECDKDLNLLCSDAGTCICGNSYIYDKNKDICKRFCRGTSEKLVKHGPDDHQYKLYKQRYTNCTYVDGNLEITSLGQNYDMSFLNNIEEVTGYVLIVSVFSSYLNLTSLRIIRGMTLFHYQERDYSLYVALNANSTNSDQGLRELQFKSLQEIMRGEVYFHNNNLLCLLDSIRWDDVNPTTSPHVHIEYDSIHFKRDCTDVHCDRACYNSFTKDYHCWGTGPDMCQTLNHIKGVCSGSCDRRCFGNQQQQCCHPECAAGCSGQRKTDCFACRNFYNDGQCEPHCPQMYVYDSSQFRMVPNPNGKYTFGSLCVSECPTHMLKNQGACVIQCPNGTQPNATTSECIPCDGPCPKNCPGTDYLKSTNIKDYKGCTVIQGNLKILGVTFSGDEHKGVAGISSMKELDALKDVKEISGHLNIQETPLELKNLSFLSSLETIHGRLMDVSGSTFTIMRSRIETLGLTSLKRISNGKAFIIMNNNLCYLENLSFRDTNIFVSKQQHLTVRGNLAFSDCRDQQKVCHSECSPEGCWGPGPSMCLRCRNWREGQNNTCVSSCSDLPLMYPDSDRTCSQCHEQCATGCLGPGPKNCTACKNVTLLSENNTRLCMEACPDPLDPPYLYPDENRVCRPCDDRCAEGCTGPSNVAGVFGGCTTCELAINRTLENGTVDCLSLTDMNCPHGYYISRYMSDIHFHLNKKMVCQPCDPLCLSCNAPSTINCPECRYFKHITSPSSSTSNCVEECPRYTYPEDKLCKMCHSQCMLGCTGPNNTDCKSCHNFKLIINPENKTFACVEKCPDHLPHLVDDTESETPSRTVCADEDHPNIVAMKAKNKDEERKKILTIALPVCAGVLLLGGLLALFGYYWRQRERAKENTVKLTARMTGVVVAEPLTPTDAKPDLSQLRLIRESEMRRGGIIGSGAFGTVYKGFWIPEGENVKIPVAIKVLQEGTSPNQNQELLEEARVMASVDHPCCIRILAVCLASQMMLITQLMPLGCLLDYIRKHKDNTGSKALLNWCTQIARGMAYLEERGIVHRDLAARNVLVQSAGQVKITDFGLAKLLDYDEEEYHAAGGKMPIKWLALECIQHRIFTHKSDVWSYGVTVWELFTYGNRPYENVRARDVPDLLEKGERLPQPPICTIDVYMIMIKCWMLDADSRPTFVELAEEFAKMARDPGRYLVIQGDVLKKIPSEEHLELPPLDVPFEPLGVESEGDKLMRLPSYSYDKNDLARHLSVAADGPEEVIEAEDYLQPQPSHPHAAENNNFKPQFGNVSPGASNIDKPAPKAIREKRYGHLESAAAARQQRELSPTNRLRGDSINGRYSSDPVRQPRERDEMDGNVMLRVPSPLSNGTVQWHDKPASPPTDPVLRLPIDEDDYLQPKSSHPQAYLDLIDGKDYYLNEKAPPPPEEEAPQYIPPDPVRQAFENPEYFERDDSNEVFAKKPVKPKIAPKPRRLTDYYNEMDNDKSQKERRPLLSSSCSNSESTV